MLSFIKNALQALKYFLGAWSRSSDRLSAHWIRVAVTLMCVPIARTKKFSEPQVRIGQNFGRRDERLHGLARDGFLMLPRPSECLMSRIHSDFLSKIDYSGEKIVSKGLVNINIIEELCRSADIIELIKSHMAPATKNCGVVCHAFYERREVQEIAPNMYDNATRFHRDCEGRVQLKAFLYLSDVNLHNGPHIFLPGTHRPRSLNMLRHMERHSNPEELTDAGRVLTIIGAAGTFFLEDTFAWHAGGDVQQGTRNMLTLAFYAHEDFKAWAPLIGANSSTVCSL